MLTPEDISSRQFLISLRGYDRDEVEGFLHQVAADFAGLQVRIKNLEEQLQTAQSDSASAAAPGSPRETFQGVGEETTRILVAAEESAQEIRQRAADQARREVEQALQEARREVQGARRNASQIIADAERRQNELADEMRELEATREQLKEELARVMESVQTAARGLGVPASEEPAEDADGGTGPDLEEQTDEDDRDEASGEPDDDGLVADNEHVDPDTTTRLALEADREDVEAVGAAVAASPATDEETVDDALEVASTTAELDVAHGPDATVTTADEAAEEEEPTEAPAGPDLAERRSNALAEVRPGMLRRMKRGLQDVQNGVLDAIRRHADGAEVDQLLPQSGELAPIGEVAQLFLTAAYRAGIVDGAAVVGEEPPDDQGNETRVFGTVATFQTVLAHEITSSLTATLRAGLEAGEPETSLSERVGEVFRDLKGPVIEAAVEEQLTRAYGFGMVDSWDELGAAGAKSWVLGQEPRCPANQCRTNANEGPVGLGDAFPSGDRVPPAHDACTCTLAPA